MRRTDIGSLAQKAPLLDGVRHADREARRRLRSAQRGLAMTGVQAFYAQYLLWAKRGLTMSALADYSRTTQANVSQVVSRMERHGLVARERSPRDGRGVIVRITAYGAHQFALVARRLRAIERALSRRIASRARSATTSALRALPLTPAHEPQPRTRPLWTQVRGQARPPWA